MNLLTIFLKCRRSEGLQVKLFPSCYWKGGKKTHLLYMLFFLRILKSLTVSDTKKGSQTIGHNPSMGRKPIFSRLQAGASYGTTRHFGMLRGCTRHLRHATPTLQPTKWVTATIKMGKEGDMR